MMMRGKRKRGFTLVEVIATLALTLFLMGALFQAMLNQSRTNEIVSARLGEAQIARSLLYRMADELRHVQPPMVTEGSTERARRLLMHGQRNWGGDETDSPSVGEGSESDPNDFPRLDGAERFALLGTADRLLFLTRRSAESPSSIDRFRNQEMDQPAEASKTSNRVEANRWSDLRQVFYLPKPRPEALEDRPNETPVEMTPDGKPPIEPVFGGVIRQEVRLLFHNFAHEDSFHHLRDHLFAKEDEGFELPEVRPPDVGVVEEQIPLSDRTETRVLTDKVTALRFRYHDGQLWQTAWSDAYRLPTAIEIHLSFDERAADPKFLSDYLEEHPFEQPVDGELGTVPASPSPSTEEEEEPLFAYRLVVALPLAEQRWGRPEETPASGLPATPEDLVPSAEGGQR